MDNTLINDLAERFQALSDPNRLKILVLLYKSSHPVCVNGLAKKLEISQSAVSQHLKILRQAGLVTVRKEGYYKHFSLSVEGIEEFKKMEMKLLV